ncbi:unnamed protein product [Vitrella brassicaformis CCMP3155]|uniref:Uncharacterized protein n=1 Tax=Vitrella brassicaformis (strain CCMP3155) TaxID=1169540 RepID=A0A0G4ED66_VITBC|nr:unnamed protein product [Vitrella brassicaformis CCMP3155]|eukprot:CEL93627.1 unnamed protein product [Vitrella brassicaformis CCMP3155]
MLEASGKQHESDAEERLRRVLSDLPGHHRLLFMTIQEAYISAYRSENGGPGPAIDLFIIRRMLEQAVQLHSSRGGQWDGGQASESDAECASFTDGMCLILVGCAAMGVDVEKAYGGRRQVPVRRSGEMDTTAAIDAPAPAAADDDGAEEACDDMTDEAPNNGADSTPPPPTEVHHTPRPSAQSKSTPAVRAKDRQGPPYGLDGPWQAAGFLATHPLDRSNDDIRDRLRWMMVRRLEDLWAAAPFSDVRRRVEIDEARLREGQGGEGSEGRRQLQMGSGQLAQDGGVNTRLWDSVEVADDLLEKGVIEAVKIRDTDLMRMTYATKRKTASGEDMVEVRFVRSDGSVCAECTIPARHDCWMLEKPIARYGIDSNEIEGETSGGDEGAYQHQLSASEVRSKVGTVHTLGHMVRRPTNYHIPTSVVNELRECGLDLSKTQLTSLIDAEKERRKRLWMDLHSLRCRMAFGNLLRDVVDSCGVLCEGRMVGFYIRDGITLIEHTDALDKAQTICEVSGRTDGPHGSSRGIEGLHLGVWGTRQKQATVTKETQAHPMLLNLLDDLQPHLNKIGEYVEILMGDMFTRNRSGYHEGKPPLRLQGRYAMALTINKDSAALSHFDSLDRWHTNCCIAVLGDCPRGSAPFVAHNLGLRFPEFGPRDILCLPSMLYSHEVLDGFEGFSRYSLVLFTHDS